MFDAVEYISNLENPELLNIPEGRRILTEYDPLLFAMVYLPHHIKSESTGGITLSLFHEALIEYAKQWIKPLDAPAQFRDAFIAPRECGKSTWLFTLLPLWAAAHGHVTFIAAFSDSAKQSEAHLATFKHELDTNDLLRQDFPRLCEPMKRTGVERSVADNRYQIHQANDFVFVAKGVDSATLGMKVGNRRPELLILDDIEPGEAQYSAYQIDQRLKTVQDVIFPLNLFARVVISGTTTMPGSIIHQMIESLEPVRKGEEDSVKHLAWVKDENITVQYFPAIIELDNGEEESIWPEKWSMEYLSGIRHTRSFMKNMMNKPLSLDGQFWSPEDFIIRAEDFYGNTILSIDPAVTANKVSDYTGFSVISRNSSNQGEIYVRAASHAKATPAQIKQHVLNYIDKFPEIGLVIIETNQGGDTWREILGEIPVKIKTIHQSTAKAVRAQKALNHYQKLKVYHTNRFPILEEEMMGFPNVAHDDTLDATVTGVLYFLDGKARKRGPRARQQNYV